MNKNNKILLFAVLILLISMFYSNYIPNNNITGKVTQNLSFERCSISKAGWSSSLDSLQKISQVKQGQTVYMYINTNNCVGEELTFELYRVRKRFILGDKIILEKSETKTVPLSEELSASFAALINSEDTSSSQYRFRVRLTKYLQNSNQTNTTSPVPPQTNSSNQTNTTQPPTGNQTIQINVTDILDPNSWEVSSIFSSIGCGANQCKILDSYSADINTIYIFFFKTTDIYSGIIPWMDLYFAKSTDGGVTWSSTQVEYHTFVNFGSFEVFGNSISASYTIDPTYNDKYNLDFQMVFAKSTDGGATWSKSVIYSNYQDKLGKINFDSDYMVYVDVNAPPSSSQYQNSALILSKSTDGGATWSVYSTIDSSNSPKIIENQKIIKDSNIIYVAYQIGTIGASSVTLNFAKSTDGGATWSKSTVEGPVSYIDLNSFKVSNNIIYLGYNNDLYQVVLAKSTDGGATWSKSTVEDTNNLRSIYGAPLLDFPSISVLNSSVIVMAYYQHQPEYNLKLKVSSDGGQTWSSMITIDPDQISGKFSSMSVSNNGDLIINYQGIDGPKSAVYQVNL